MKLNDLRIVPVRTNWPHKTVLKIQKRIRGMSQYQIVEDMWVDCTDTDITDVVLTIFKDNENV